VTFSLDIHFSSIKIQKYIKYDYFRAEIHNFRFCRHMHWRQRPSSLVGRRSSLIVGITHFKIQMSLSQKASTTTDRAKGSPGWTNQSKRLQGFAPLLRLTLLGACVGWLSRKTLRSIFLPFGLAKRLPEVPTYAPVDFSNDSLMAKRKFQRVAR
jgi:hypothetical protein